MAIVFEPTKAMLDVPTHYCPGCTHGIIHRLIGECIEELEILDKTIGVAPVGCSVLAYNYFACDMFEAAHGRAPAVATGIKRANPDKIVFTYQGDGDLAAIGTGEIVHAAARRENIVSIFVNNCIYGMTGGQMAPTTLPGQVTETSPYGRDTKTQGYPLKIAEMIATVDGAYSVERTSVDSVQNVVKTKKAIKQAFQNVIDGKGFSMVEVLSICPTNWGLNIEESLNWVRSSMMKYYPLGVKKQGEDV
ncbi:2-oxoglutarate ferredoxin oxidoreductase subunit beta [Clostridium cavendishii DSM 21758]|uniref:2-oxoglutarate ferredoxin oxidoreductase subunit beta n=1 Tax=Clostridium cavendishii DSM 21758 TaxID=1121302 RepID=A0A1M6LXP5_9CLOT|nr:thiamine pyrophosphate-dependent enzyme [Clostridium cavendishii]SHJ75873.1 2-oxoglutarate ferredoxin oxidoreductase subunit beta [Clostridium cavendishii DSM 21758]